MTISKMDLARMMLERIKEEPKLTEYLEVSEIPLGEDEISLAELFYHLDVYYNKAATVKSALEFLIEDVGIDKTYCILVVAIADETLYEALAKIVADDTEGFIVARAKTLKEASKLTDYFTLNKWACGLITEVLLPDGHCKKLLKKCEDLPICAVGKELSVHNYVQLLAHGANVVIETAKIEDLERDIQMALVEMFLD